MARNCAKGCDDLRVKNSPYCQSCRNEYARGWYWRNQGKTKERARVSAQRSRASGRVFIGPLNKYRRDPVKRAASIKRWREDKRADYLASCKNSAAKRRAAISGGRVTRAEWDAIKANFGQCCAYCKRRAVLTMDHVIPLSKGGEHSAKNIVPACRPCNSGKRDMPVDQYLARKGNV